MQSRRPGFTLVELLVVISILLILSTLVFAVFNSGRSSDRLPPAARTAQSAFLGAKDRALHAKDLRGIRLTRDLTNPALVSGFVYLQPLPLQSAGNLNGQPAQLDISVLRPNTGTGNFDATNIEVKGVQGATWHAQDQASIWPASSVQIRVPAATGQWYQLSRLNSSPPYWGMIDANNRLNFFLQTGVQSTDNPPPDPIAVDFSSSHASCEIQLGNDLLPFHQPITLSSAVVIDLNFSSANVQSLATNSNIDVMFSPRGAVSGYIAGLGPMHFLLRDLKDATATANYQIQDASSNNIACGGFIVGPDVRATTAVGYWGTQDPNQNDRLILTVFPQTGLVQVFEIDPTDKVDNYTAATTPDGLADNLFNFAQQGKAAGR